MGERAVLIYIKQNPGCSGHEIVKALGLSYPEAYTIIKKLADSKVISKGPGNSNLRIVEK